MEPFRQRLNRLAELVQREHRERLDDGDYLSERRQVYRWRRRARPQTALITEALRRKLEE